MCDCIDKIKEQINSESRAEDCIVYIDTQEIKQELKVNGEVTLIGKTATNITIGKRQPYSSKIKKHKFSLTHIYCPFCGVKYEN